MNTQNMPIYTTACVNMESRRVFAPYFKARWQNLQNIVNDTVFFSQVPTRFFNYFRTYVQQWLDWARGFVPQLHKGDFFSTGMGYTVCDIFARECMSGGWRINCKDDNTSHFLEKWTNERFEHLLNKMFFYSNAGGNALLVLTPVNGDIYPSVLPANRFFFDIGRSGKISCALLYNRFSTDDDGYYAMETRMTVGKSSYYLVELHKGTKQALSPDWNKERGLFKVPDEARVQWEYNYGNIQPAVWYKLPDNIGIGLYNVPNKSVAVSVSDIPGYADSTLHTALDILYSIDFNYTCGQLDQYWGRSRVLLPKEMQPRRIITDSTGMVSQVHESRVIESFDTASYAALGEDIYAKVVDSNAIDGKPIQPEFIQPDLRGEAHKFIRDADLELLASKVGLSSATLANHLSYNNPKTATQVVSENDTTAISVNNKRALATVAIDEMLADIVRFYGLSGEAHIIWNKYGAMTPTQNSELLADYQAGVIPKEEYIKRRYPDLTEKEVAEWMTKLENEEPPMVRDYNLGGF